MRGEWWVVGDGVFGRNCLMVGDGGGWVECDKGDGE